MDRRKAIIQTVQNRGIIYDDIGRICQLIEEKMKNLRFNPMGNKAVTWETSISLECPDLWLHRYFARVYVKRGQPKKAVGFCIHLGDYDEESNELFSELNLNFPLVTVSLLKFENKAIDFERRDIYEML